MTKSKESSTPDVLSTVNLLRSLDLMPLPIALKSKVTYCKNYTDPAFVSPYNDWKNSNIGVGVVLSSRYKLVDIDIDDPRIADLSVSHLPQGGWIFGRKSKKMSHHVFVMSDETDTTQIQRASDPKNKGYMDTEKVLGIGINNEPRPTIIEFRGDGSQTVMPGTLHAGTGEKIEWHEGKIPTSLPAAVDSYELRRAVRKIGFTVMVADYAWGDGIRHDVSLCLAGMMVAAKWTQAEAEHWFQCLVAWTRQGDIKNVLSCVRDTYKSAGKKDRIQGGPKLTEITGVPGLVSEFRKMFMDIRESVFEDLNARYALGVYFGKVQVFDFNVIDDVSIPDFETISTADFELLLSNDKVKVPGKKGDVWVPKSKFWLGHKDRRTYRVTDFMPGMGSEVGEKLNLWRGWGVKPNASGSIDHWMHHLDKYICDGDQDMKHWLLAWLADIVQHPMHKPGTAVMMRSEQRSGKNTFVEMMKKVIGIRYFREMNSSGQITNRFNSHIQYALMIMANEADFASSQAASNVLKTIITDKDFHMDHKHGHAKTGKNFTRVVLASNKLHVIERDHDDQRYTVIDVVHPSSCLSTEERIKHFTDIYAEIDGDGPAKLLDFLMNYQYERDLLRNCYQSAAGRAQILLSMDPVAQWWAKCLSAGRIHVPDQYLDQIDPEAVTGGWPRYVGKTALEAAFRDQHRDNNKIASPAFHSLLYRCSGLTKDNTRQVGRHERRYRALVMPDLDKSIAMINSMYQGAVDTGAEDIDDLLSTPVERGSETQEEEF